MDADRFDAFVHAIALPASRRTALGAGLTAMQTRLGSEDTAARKKRRKKKKCKGGTKRCGKTCIPRGSCGGGCDEEQQCCDGVCADCCVDDDCPEDATCEGGSCVCAVADEAVCGETCVNLETDGANCGACDIVCDTGECIRGTCTCAGDFDCPGDCVCRSRAQGQPSGCAGTGNGAGCKVDADCPFGSICKLNDTCSIPCQG